MTEVDELTTGVVVSGADDVVVVTTELVVLLTTVLVDEGVDTGGVDVED